MQHHANQRTATDWILATRPWSFPASSMPIIVTTACIFWMHATGIITTSIQWANSLPALIAIILIHAAGNMWSDLSDYTSGIDTNTCYGVKTLLSGQFSPQEIKAYSLILMTIASAIGLAITYRAGLPVLAFGATGLLLTIFYPHLKHNALGDLDIFLTYAILPITGTSYILTGTIIIPQVLWLSLPLGLITVAILHINNTRDIRTDARANIRTLAMIIGHRASKITYTLEVLLPFAIIAILILLHMLPYTTAATFIALPIAISNTRATKNATPDNLKPIAAIDEKTAQLQLTFSLLLSLAFVTSAI